MDPILVIGGGPVGLAAAAQLAERGLPFELLEAGDGPGATVRDWGHVRLFSPWRYNVAPAAQRLLESDGWNLPDPDRLPTGAELIADYLAPLAAHPALVHKIRYRAPVTAISRAGYDRVRTVGRERAPFTLRLANGSELLASAVIDASGTWCNPNVLGANGLPATGEPELRAALEPAMPDVLGTDRARFAGSHTLVVGGGHSAATTLLSLAELAESAPGTRVSWAIRGGGPERTYGGQDADALPGRGALGSGLRRLVESGAVQLLTGFGVRKVASTPDGRLAVTGGSHGPNNERTVRVDRVVSATGFRPDHRIADELRLDLDPALGCSRRLAALIDPNLHSCGTVRPHGVDELTQPEPNYWIVGSKSYGRAPTFLLATGYEQTRSIVAALAGDWAAARDVHLDLPETGVCSTTAGARAIASDAAERLGLAPDIPAKLVTGTMDHYLRAEQDLDTAVQAAANDLGIERGVARQLAVLVSDQLDSMLDGDSGNGDRRDRGDETSQRPLGPDQGATPGRALTLSDASTTGGCCG